MSHVQSYSEDSLPLAEAEGDVEGVVSNMRIIDLGPSLPRNLAASLEAAQQTQFESGRFGFQDYNRIYSHTPRQDSLLPPVCAVCQTVPFDLLPSENEAALPHHTWGDLNTSATSCELCRIVLWATKKLRSTIITEVSAPVTGRQYLWGGEFISGPVPEIAPAIRVYIFASWWRKNAAAPNDLLMGLGVRFGIDLGEVGLGPGEADGRQRDGIRIRGTPIRICTDFGKLTDICFPFRSPTNTLVSWRGST
jgi:hypothetical protein